MATRWPNHAPPPPLPCPRVPANVRASPAMTFFPRASCVLGATVLFLCSLPGFAAAPATPPPPLPAARTAAELVARLEAHVMQPRFAGSLWGVRIDSLETGRTLFAHHADRLMSPASNSKLYTGALALDAFGPDHRIVTPLLARTKPDAAGTLAGDLIVSGRGDPSWKSVRRREDFREIFAPFVAALRTAGVKRITGDIVADTTWFHAAPNGAGWTADDLNDDYGAEISAVSLEDNYADLRLAPAATAGAPCIVTLLQPETGLVLDNRLVTVAAGAERQVVVRRFYDDHVVRIFGQLPVGAKEEFSEITVPRPAAWFARALKAALVRAGIAVNGGTRGVRWPDAPAAPADAFKLGEITSPPMRALVAGFMKPSQNLETDLIFAYLGETRRTAATPAWRDSETLALGALREFLRKHALPADDVRFEEGSGLSRNNLTTANATVGLLRAMAIHPAAQDFIDSLPVAGVDGSLKRRMADTAAARNVRAKTGTLRYANSLSGYVTTAAGERLAFSFMLNRNAGQPANRRVTLELDDMAVWLAGLAARSE